MDPTQFDDLTKMLASSTSRRQALKTIAATTLGGLLGLGGIGTAFAKSKCKPAGTKCTHDKQCCAGLVCQNGTCATPCTPAGSPCSGSSPCCGSSTCCYGINGATCCAGFCTKVGCSG